MALISSSLVNKRIKIDRTLKTLELIALEIKTGTNNMVIIGTIAHRKLYVVTIKHRLKASSATFATGPVSKAILLWFLAI